LDGSPIPLELNRALTYKSWGAVDVFKLPAGMIKKMNISLNYYNALQAYKRAQSQQQTNPWIKSNPEAWDIVSWVIAQRMKKWGDE